MAVGEFGELLRAARVAAGLSQEALAGRARLSADTVAALERGRRRQPRRSTVSALAAALGLTERDRAAFMRSSAGLPVPAEMSDDSANRAPGTADRARLPQPVAGAGSAGDVEMVGREADLAALGALLFPAGAVRFITMVGPGGIGKTTLARGAVEAFGDRYPDGSLFVDLSSLTELSLVAPTVARSLRLTQSVPDGPIGLIEALARRQMLLMLDSAERLPGIGTLLDAAIRANAGLTVVVTSRLPLATGLEHRFPVGPLPVPDSAAVCNCRTTCCCAATTLIRAFPAVELFTRRARAVRPGFEVDDRNATAVARLCARLDGNPLALELAAARVTLLSVQSLLDRMNRSLDLLVSRRTDRPDRNRSLRATLDWSFELLEPAVGQLFSSLAVFRGGFDVAAAEEVCGSPDRSVTVLDGLQTLADAGLVVPFPHVEGRLTMLDTVHDYARERLGAEDDRRQVAGRHLAYFLRLAQSSVDHLTGPEQSEWLEQLEWEHDNLRTAATWADRNDPGAALQLVTDLWLFWQCHGHLSEGRRRLGAALATGAGPTRLRADAGYGAAVLAFAQGDLDAAARTAEGSLARYREIGADDRVARTLNVLGNVFRERGAYARATALYEESIALSRAAGDIVGLAPTLNNLGTTARYRGRLDRARQLHEESLSLRVRAGDTRGVANCLENLADTALQAGDLDSAARYGTESLALRQGVGDRHGAAVTRVTLAGVHRACGDQRKAEQEAGHALTAGYDIDDFWVVATALATLVGVAADQGRWASAAELAGTLSTYEELTGVSLRPSDAGGLTTATAKARSKLGETRFDCAWTLGRATDVRTCPPAIFADARSRACLADHGVRSGTARSQSSVSARSSVAW